MSTENQKITLDQITDFGTVVPVGTYIARLSKLDAKNSKDKADGTPGRPMLELTWEILTGEYEGMNLKQWWPLTITKTKNGTFMARGISELKAACAAVGKALPKNTPFQTTPTLKDAQTIAKLVAERLKPSAAPRVRLQVILEDEVEQKISGGPWTKKVDEEGNVVRREKTVVLGVDTKPAAPPAAKAETTAPEIDGTPEGDVNDAGEADEAIDLLG